MADKQEAFESFDLEVNPIRGFPELRWSGKRRFTSTQFFPAQKKESYGDPVSGWTNKLFWGDNIQVMSHLLRDHRGGVDLIYIDPPFDSRADYKKAINLRNKSAYSDHSSFEEKQYGDIWGNDGYLQFMYERLTLLKELLSDTGTIFVHLDWHQVHSVKLILDELFGPDRLINEVVWKRSDSKGDAGQGSKHLARIHDTLLIYSKTASFKWNTLYTPLNQEYVEKFYKHVDENGRRYKLDNMLGPGGAAKGNPVYEVMGVTRAWRYSRERMQSMIDAGLVVQTKAGNVPMQKRFLEDSKGNQLSTIWNDISMIRGFSSEKTAYPTQKPEALLERVISLATEPGDLVLDTFMGSGTTAVTAMKQGRKFIGADINLGAVETAVKRLNEVLAEPQQDGFNNPLVRAGFELFNVNNYDIFRNPVEAKELIKEAMELQPLPTSSVFDGQRDQFLVKIMPVNRIATRQDLNEVIAGMDFKAYERRQAEAPSKIVDRIMLVCMGHEPDIGPELVKAAKPFNIEVEVVDLIRDKANLHFKRQSDAKLVIKDGHLEVAGFYPLNLLQKLSMDTDAVEDWRQLVETIKVDWNYDGAVLSPELIDAPDKNDLVSGRYPIPEDASTIRVKITACCQSPGKVRSNMAKKKINQDFAFFNALYHFVQTNRGRVRQKYRKLSKHLLDFNDPDLRTDAYLRRPQFEALEMYVFLKEFAENRHVHQVFSEWAKGEGIFEGLVKADASKSGQGLLLGFEEIIGQDQYDALFAKMSERARTYPNYIFALTMGLGKTILMATCIFYEFLLANKFGKDTKYCRNALVFAPDKTVLQSLKEIQTFDLSLVVPPEYANFLRTNLKFHFLDDTASTIGAQDGSSFNIIISNTQKIILKRSKAEQTATDKLFAEKKGTLSEVYGDLYEMLGEDAPETDADLAVNARFQRIARLPQLGIYVDEAHHSMGASLEKDLGQAKQTSALRTTIDELARALEARKTSVVGCYNFTGTPYVKDRIMPEVVYAYGLKTAIDNKYLKQPDFFTYTGNIKSNDFIREVITDFWTELGEARHEGMLPKLALFASTLEELEKDLRPAIETVLAELGVSTDKILRNTGDSTNEEIREFNRLDTEDSNKQFILLVGKGGEGWNCRSLFGVALYRKPKSRIFVLQSTMRCLRAIGPQQETGRIYLSAENQAILDDELQQNFRVTTDELGPKKDDTSVTVEVTAVPPPVIIKLKRHRELYQTVKKEQPDDIQVDLSDEAMEQFRIKLERRTHLKDKATSVEDITERQSHKTYTKLTLIGELARYFSGDDISAFDIEEVLDDTEHGLEGILRAVNIANDIIFDVLVPHIFHAFFEVKKFQKSEEEEVELIRGYNDSSNRLPEFTFKAQEHLVQRRDYPKYDGTRAKSFHLDAYCFDSAPEVEFFDRVIKDEMTEKIYFTGMLVHGQSGFQVYYIHPDSHTVCNYHPDFLVYRNDGKAHLIEVKSNWKKDDPVVLAKKEAAELLAVGNQFEYALVTKEQFDGFLKPDGWDKYQPDAMLDT